MDQEPKKKTGFFSHPEEQSQDLMSSASADFITMGRRLRLVEERLSHLQKKTQVTDQNLLSDEKKWQLEYKHQMDEITDIKRDIADVKEKVGLLVKELQTRAAKEDVDVLGRYINLWEPLNFVTKKEVERITRDVIDQMRRE